ncbi:Inosine triphosphate pyrophosphatase [Pseudoloma neurophilia]|uniref:Inosine triphosphate pyrophosphatase n=1 Tax=Pseudoloma neurophilia TaxID=146866 RepID=A0A0R0M6S0_9MICR|nr:Inosine triphosphate pyrophosphatase [Pseudoloma neurophilia]
MTTSPIKLYFVTSNSRKFEEIEQLLGVKVHKFCVDLIEIQGKCDDVIKHKISEAKKLFDDKKEGEFMLLIDDTCYHIEGLGGFPGPYARDFLEIGFKKIFEIAQKIGKEVHYSTRLCLVYKNEIKIFKGTAHGEIGPPSIINNKRFYDYITYIDGKLVSEMTIDEKNQTSPRSKACKQVMEYLKEKKLFERIG